MQNCNKSINEFLIFRRLYKIPNKISTNRIKPRVLLVNSHDELTMAEKYIRLIDRNLIKPFNSARRRYFHTSYFDHKHWCDFKLL
jgi:hypothetical protein